MRNILSSLVCLVCCLLVWAAEASAAESRVLVLPFAVNASSAQAQLARDVPSLVDVIRACRSCSDVQASRLA